ncbi:MAG: replication protein [Nitrospirae bacterium]|nr:replication protein [Nitrospirota bacterium]
MDKPDYKMPIERNKGNGQKTKGIPANLKVDGYDSLISQFKMKANGNFTMFDNDILEELPRCKIRLEATKTYLWLYRKLIGYQKIIDRISLSQIEEGTGLSKRSVPRALEELLKHNMIIKIKVHGNNYYGLTSVEIWTSRVALKLADKKMIQGELFTSDMPRVAQICATSAGDKRKKLI